MDNDVPEKDVDDETEDEETDEGEGLDDEPEVFGDTDLNRNPINQVE